MACPSERVRLSPGALLVGISSALSSPLGIPSMGNVCSRLAVLAPLLACAWHAAYRITNTGTLEWVNTFCVWLPSTIAETPRRACDAITIKSHCLSLAVFTIAFQGWSLLCRAFSACTPAAWASRSTASFSSASFDRFGVDDARQVLGDQISWHRTVQRQCHRHSNDLGPHDLGEVDAVTNSAFAEFRAIRGKQDALVHEITSFPLSQVEAGPATIVRSIGSACRGLSDGKLIRNFSVVGVMTYLMRQANAQAVAKSRMLHLPAKSDDRPCLQIQMIGGRGSD